MSMLDQHEHKHPVHDFDGITENRASSTPVYFTVLFYGLIIWGVAFSAYYILSDWSSEGEFRQEMESFQEQVAARQPQPPEKSQAPAVAAKPEENGEAEDDDQAEELFASNCAACHGASGEGGIGPSLADEQYKYGRTEAAIGESITEGRPGGMPAFGNQLSGEEIESLTRYVLSLGE